METFSKLKYWRGSGAAAANVRATAATIATSVLRSSMAETSSSSSEEDEGSFFDLEFSANKNEAETVVENCDSSSESESEEEGENSSDNSLLFKGQLLPLDVDEPSSIVIASSSDNNKLAHFSVSLLKSATKFRVFMLGLKKPKPSQSSLDQNAANTAVASPNHNKFFIKFNVEEVPIVSLFARQTRSKKNTKMQTVVENQEEEEEGEKKLNASPKETVQKYISKIKPLYVRVSKRYGEKLRLSGLLTAEDEAAVRLPPTLAGARIVRKRLGKSKSVVAAVASPPVVSQRRDDSLRQQQDGIQSAIAHCKMTLNAAKGLQSPLVRSKSDPTDDRSEKVNAVL